MEVYLAFICMFGPGWAPRGWLNCWGNTLSISQNTALFSLLGTTYGGNGQTTFAIPDLRGRTPVGYGNGPGLNPYEQGQWGGDETMTLMLANMPAHNHYVDLNGLKISPSATAAAATTHIPAAGMVHAALPTFGSGPSSLPVKAYALQDNTVKLAPNVIEGTVHTAAAGSNQPFPIMQPYLAVNFIIATEGIFPSRS